MTMVSTRPSTATLRTALRPGIQVTPGGPGLLVGGERTGRLPVKDTPGARAVLAALAGDPQSENDLAARVITEAGAAAVLDMHMLLARLAAAGFVTHTLDRDGEWLATLRVVGQGSARLGGALATDALVRLSRFAQAGADGGVLSVRAPRSALALDLAPELAALLGLLVTPRTPAELSDHVGDAAAPVLRLFAAAGLLVDETDTSEQWNPTDLWLHAHARGSKTVAGYGGTYLGRGAREPEPARTPHRWEQTIELERPDLDAIGARDPSFTEVLEGRRSRRVHDDANPITLPQLGELLYRSARLRRSYSDGAGEEVADRPYPSGGATHELELYPLVTNCTGLEPGLYHYRGDDHCLELVAPPGPALAGLVGRARAAAVMAGDPQVVLLVSARFGRVMFKYETIAYSLILKHVGVLYQTLYLVGTAMGLAVCGLGGGDADAFAEASGLDWFAEGTVGELVLGSAGNEQLWTGEVAPS